MLINKPLDVVVSTVSSESSFSAIRVSQIAPSLVSSPDNDRRDPSSHGYNHAPYTVIKGEGPGL
jgi:hypothetical protein